MTRDLPIEARAEAWLSARLPGSLGVWVLFVVKQLWACLFGLSILAAIILSKAIWQADWPIWRYDALVVFAVAMQGLMLALKLESKHEALVILIFHITGTVMELFKTSAGSWAYPEAGYLKIGMVPLFTGFMYASVGSYMARAIRLFDIRFAPYPPFWTTVLLATAIYVNFYSHHFLPDARVVLFAGTVLLFWRTRVHMRLGGSGEVTIRLPLAALATAFGLWIAENIGTFTGTWLYHGQSPWDRVRLGTMGSWYLLIYVAFVTVTLVYRDMLLREPLVRASRASGPRQDRSPETAAD